MKLNLFNSTKIWNWFSHFPLLYGSKLLNYPEITASLIYFKLSCFVSLSSMQLFPLSTVAEAVLACDCCATAKSNAAALCCLQHETTLSCAPSRHHLALAKAISESLIFKLSHILIQKACRLNFQLPRSFGRLAQQVPYFCR